MVPSSTTVFLEQLPVPVNATVIKEFPRWVPLDAHFRPRQPSRFGLHDQHAKPRGGNNLIRTRYLSTVAAMAISAFPAAPVQISVRQELAAEALAGEPELAAASGRRGEGLGMASVGVESALGRAVAEPLSAD